MTSRADRPLRHPLTTPLDSPVNKFRCWILRVPLKFTISQSRWKERKQTLRPHVQVSECTYKTVPPFIDPSRHCATLNLRTLLSFPAFFLAYITPDASRSCLVYGCVFIIDMSLSADDNNSSEFSRFTSAVAASTHHPVKKMRDQAYRICRDYLSGSWKSISSNDMVFRSIRWVRVFLFTSCAGPVPGLVCV